MMSESLFTIAHTKDLIAFENHSSDILHVYEKPMKPKRKINLICVVQPDSFLMWDLTLHGEIDLSKLLFCLEKS